MQTIQAVLKSQRQKCSLSPDMLGQFLYTAKRYAFMKKQYPLWPVVPYNYNNYNMGRPALMKQAYSLLPLYHSTFNYDNDQQALYGMISSNHQMPGSVSTMMFVKCIQLMGNQEQIQKYLKKSKDYQIVGAYAQTEIGHGSDVRGLLTTATYDEKTQQFQIDTPTINAAKFWPGELGLIANYALVYAQLIIKGKNYGVQAFFVPIRDQNQQVLPGIQSGDIGPKFGYHAKQNGFLLLHKIRVPRQNLLGRYNEVTAQGKFISKGDPRIAYATMMKIRLFISVICPRIYGAIITVAARYSMFRSQFKGKNGQTKIIDYQTQQDKIISRVAQSYAILSAGHKVQQISLKNQQLIKNKGDSSLLQETHIILCFTKALFSEIIIDGMEICRKSCGGHGFSHYAGFNTALGQYYTNPTHEGQNTILYLQVAKFLMKAYQNSMTKQKPLSQSVKYIQSIQYYQQYRSLLTSSSQWTPSQMLILLSQGCTYLIKQIAQGMMSKAQGLSDLDYFNYQCGSKLQKLGIIHGYRYTYQAFVQRIMGEKHQQTKDVLMDLALVFGCNVLISSNVNFVFVSAGFLNKEQVATLSQLRATLFAKLRPNLIGLVDAYGFPEHLIRSELAHGNPYENYLDRARECQINQKIQQSAFIVKGIKDVMKNSHL